MSFLLCSHLRKPTSGCDTNGNGPRVMHQKTMQMPDAVRARKGRSDSASHSCKADRWNLKLVGSRKGGSHPGGVSSYLSVLQLALSSAPHSQVLHLCVVFTLWVCSGPSPTLVLSVLPAIYSTQLFSLDEDSFPASPPRAT